MTRRFSTLSPLAGVAAIAVGLAASFTPLPQPAAAQGLGGALAVSGHLIMAGEASHERLPGTVRVYSRYDHGWSELTPLTGPDAAVRDGFGRALTNSGGLLFVGAGGEHPAVHAYPIGDVGLSGDLGPSWSIHAGDLVDIGGVIAARGSHLLVAGRLPGEGGGAAAALYRVDGQEGPHLEAILQPPAAEPASRGRGPGAGRAPRPTTIGQMVMGDGIVVMAPSPANQPGVAAVVFRRGDGPDGEWGSPEVLSFPAETGAEPLPATAVALSGGAVLAADMRQAVYEFSPAPAGWTSRKVVAEGSGFGPVALATSGSRVVVASAQNTRVFSTAGAGRDGATGEWVMLSEAPALADAPGTQSIGGLVAAMGGPLGAVGNPAEDFGAGALRAFVASDEHGTSWEYAGRLITEQVGLAAISGGQVDCEEGNAAGFDCDGVDLLSFLPREEIGAARGARLNDVWGWTDPLTGREYAIVGRMDGTAFVDVTDAYGPRYLGNLAKTEGSNSSTWRDMKVFRDHVFIVADGAGQHGMQVFDLTRLRDVREAREFEPDHLYTDIASSHNVAINEETGYAYLVGSSGGGETCGGGSHMVDINDPANPVFAGCLAHEGTGRRGTGNAHDAQCVVYAGPDADYAGREVCISANETALSIQDVTDKTDPLIISSAEYANSAYVHQGWLTEDHRYFYSNDELDETGGLVDRTRTLVWDVSDLEEPVLVREHMNQTSVTDHNLYTRGDRLFMANNRAGLRIMDITDPENPVEVGHFDTTPWSEDSAGFDGTWSVYPYFASGTILLSSRREGLFLVKPVEERLIP